MDIIPGWIEEAAAKVVGVVEIAGIIDDALEDKQPTESEALELGIAVFNLQGYEVVPDEPTDEELAEVEGEAVK